MKLLFVNVCIWERWTGATNCKDKHLPVKTKGQLSSSTQADINISSKALIAFFLKWIKHADVF